MPAFLLDAIHPQEAIGSGGRGPPHQQGFTITLKHTTPRRTPLDE